MRSRQDFIDQAITWLREIIEEDVDKVVLSGGTAEYLGKMIVDDIETNFPWLEISWHGGIEIPEELLEMQLDNYKRFADVYGEWLYKTRNS